LRAPRLPCVFPYTTLFRSRLADRGAPLEGRRAIGTRARAPLPRPRGERGDVGPRPRALVRAVARGARARGLRARAARRRSERARSEEHTSELQAPYDLVSR